MRKNLILCLLTTVLTLVICSCAGDDNNPVTPKDDFKEVKTLEIGPNGGELSTENVSITIPEGTFSGVSKITLSESKTSKPFNKDNVGSVYEIKGIPEALNNSILIKIKADGYSSENTQIALGIFSDIKSYSDSLLKYIFIETKDSSGYLIASITPNQNGLIRNKKHEHQLIDRELSTMRITASTNRGNVKNEHFEIKYSSSIITEVQAQELLGFFNEMFSFYTDMGFDMNKYKYWPVSVYVGETGKNDQNESHAGEYSPIGYIFNAYFNIYHGVVTSGKYETTKITIGHEFLHFIQDFYYYFSLSGCNGWFDDASCSYVEKLFQENPSNDFIPLNTNGYAYYCFSGLSEGYKKVEGGTPDRQGYANATLLEFLMNKYGAKNGNVYRLKSMLEKISSGTNLLELVKSEFGDYKDWIDEYFQSMYENRIYGKAFEPVSKTEWHVVSYYDTIKEFTDNYYDLSCNLYRVVLEKIDDNAQLKIVATGKNNDKISLNVYSLLGGKNKIDSKKGNDTITLFNLSKITKINSKQGIIPIMVINQDCHNDCSNSNEIKLTIKIIPDDSLLITSILPLNANIGDIVTIKGRGFGNNPSKSSVTFNGKEKQSYYEWNDTLIKCTIPYYATSGDVVVTVNGKKSRGFYYEIGITEDNVIPITLDTVVTGTFMFKLYSIDKIYFPFTMSYNVSGFFRGDVRYPDSPYAFRESLSPTQQRWTIDSKAPGKLSYEATVSVSSFEIDNKPIEITRTVNGKLCKIVVKYQPSSGQSYNFTSYLDFPDDCLMKYLPYQHTITNISNTGGKFTYSMDIPTMEVIDGFVRDHNISPYKKGSFVSVHLKTDILFTADIYDATTGEFISTETYDNYADWGILVDFVVCFNQ